MTVITDGPAASSILKHSSILYFEALSYSVHLGFALSYHPERSAALSFRNTRTVTLSEALRSNA